jgi:flagellar protein FlgJ
MLLSTPSNATDTSVYTDFSALHKLKNQAQTDSPQAIKQVAKQFEALFFQNILKSMRAAKLADGLFDSDESKSYNEMYDQQLSVHLAEKSGTGLADMIVKQLSPHDAKAPRTSLADYLNHPVTPASFYQYSHQFDDESDEMSFKNGRGLPIQSAVNFVRKLQPFAQQAAKVLGVDPNALLAQAALESGWGNAVIKNGDGTSSFNLFNIKADRSWKGKQTFVSSLEFDQGIARRVSSGFRSYHSFQESFNDYVDFIKNNPRYENALKKVGDAEQYMYELQRAGYATDPSYADKVVHIYRSNAINLFAGQGSIAME